MSDVFLRQGDRPSERGKTKQQAREAARSPRSLISGAASLALLALVVSAGSLGIAACGARSSSAPDRLTDEDFWRLSTRLSEPAGVFRHSENLVSNEDLYAYTIRLLRCRGGVYVGVGPEQNFSYIARIQPAMAFIVDIRRQAIMQHLMFKAVFELAKDRAEFISLLFAKPRPAGLEDPALPIQKIWEAYFPVQSDFGLRTKNYTRLADQITKVHKFTLTEEEQRMFDDVFQAFYSYGPSISTRGACVGRTSGSPRRALSTRREPTHHSAKRRSEPIPESKTVECCSP